jgi:UDP-3-O-[3-hydroxymyristoyl] glucosamine N-acyltransferase
MIALSQLAKMLGLEVHGGFAPDSPKRAPDSPEAGSNSLERVLNSPEAGPDSPKRAPDSPGSQPQLQDPKVIGVSSIRKAVSGSLVFAEDPASFREAMASAATAILTSPQAAGDAQPEKPLLLCEQPKLAFARAAKLLASLQPSTSQGIHPAAVVSSSAYIAEDVSIGPCAVVGPEARVGRGSTIGSGAVVGRGVVIGEGCHLYPRAVLYSGTTLENRVIVHAGAVLGGDGFGYVRDRTTGEYIQFPQQGTLVIEDDVEIGANTTIDRGALEETRIGRGAKIDNLVHIGHNVSIGRNAVIAAQTGISGSSGVGNDAILGGQVGIGDHAFVGDGVILGGQAGILPHKNLEGRGILFWGTPAQPVKRYLRQLGTLARLSRSVRHPGGTDTGDRRQETESSREDGACSSPKGTGEG